MRLSSLAYTTDLMFFHNGDAVVRDRGDYLFIESPENPTYYWGNFLILPEPPGPGDLKRWEALFREEFRDRPLVRHTTFGWDDPEGRLGDIEPFRAAGYEIEESLVLTAPSVRKPANLNPAVTVKPLQADSEWEAATLNQIVCRSPEYEAIGYAEFMRRRMESFRRTAEAGWGHWFGAFVDGHLVGDLGLFVEHGVGRFQAVATDPGFRRRGVCRTLVHAAAETAFRQMGAEVLVLVAARGTAVLRTYEALGFRLTERQVGACWWERPPA
jgi:ribosomal protein S18 acetylase RimI-like enzyme